MFYSKGMSHLGFPLANNKGNSTPFPLLPCMQPRCTTPHKAAPPQAARKNHGDGGKRKQERNPNRFLERNNDNEWRRALPFSSPLLSLSPVKSHDCHVLMTQLLPVALRGILLANIRATIIKLCAFLNAISQKAIDPMSLIRLQEDVV